MSLEFVQTKKLSWKMFKLVPHLDQNFLCIRSMLVLIYRNRALGPFRDPILKIGVKKPTSTQQWKSVEEMCLCIVRDESRRVLRTPSVTTPRLNLKPATDLSQIVYHLLYLGTGWRLSSPDNTRGKMLLNVWESISLFIFLALGGKLKETIQFWWTSK